MTLEVIKLLRIALVASFAWSAAAQAADCPRAGALGTSRILAVDPATTPRVGLKSFPQTLALADREVVLTFDDGPWPATTSQVLAALAREVQTRLDSASARIGLDFPYFVHRAAPVTGGTAPVEYGGRLHAEARDTVTLRVGVRVPIASLCPCSKEISDYGAHNQRGYVDIDVVCADGATVWIEDLIGAAEGAASAPVYALLKRPDERFVTMQAYENPAFVEDIARDVAVTLREDARIESFVVTVRNLESIHAHDAVATIRGRR